MTDREYLITYWAGTQDCPTGMHPDIAEVIADFILADRKRIVEPLVKLELCNGGSHYEHLCQGIEATLKLAGVKE